MSTPNTSLVKWVLEKDLFASYAKVAEYQERDNIAAPVIALDDLTALVEGLRDIIGQAHGGAMLGGDDAYTACLTIEVQAHTILAQLEAHRKEG